MCVTHDCNEKSMNIATAPLSKSRFTLSSERSHFIIFFWLPPSLERAYNGSDIAHIYIYSALINQKAQKKIIFGDANSTDAVSAYHTHTHTKSKIFVQRDVGLSHLRTI